VCHLPCDRCVAPGPTPTSTHGCGLDGWRSRAAGTGQDHRATGKNRRATGKTATAGGQRHGSRRARPARAAPPERTATRSPRTPRTPQEVEIDVVLGHAALSREGAPVQSRPAIGRDRVPGRTERHGGRAAADAAGARRSDGRVGHELPYLLRIEARQGDLGLRDSRVHRRFRQTLITSSAKPGLAWTPCTRAPG